MRLEFRDARVWRYSMISIAKIIDEASFQVDESGLRLRALDSSSIVLADFEYPRDAFTVYELKGKDYFGVSMEDFTKILKRAGKGDELLLEKTPDGRLSIVFKGRGVRRFSIPNLDIPPQEIPDIQLKFSVKAKMLPKILKDVVNEMEPISDTIIFEAVPEEEKIIVKAYGDIAEAEVELSVASGALLEFEASSRSKSSFTVDYLANITAAAQVSEYVYLEFADEAPIKLEYGLPQEGKLTFYVAPRTESE
uniref:DNA polymerase sliding clamp n=1 Tax=Thermosphaera aggregans TaxID=54254 RepID=A0A7C2BL12_9CREN